MADTDLCSVEDVRLELQRQSGETGSDPVLAAKVTAASLEIMREFEREFAPASTGVTRKFEVGGDYGSTILSLAPYDLRSVTSVKLDADLSSPYTLSTAEYRLGPRPNRDGVYTWIRLRPQTTGSPMWFPDVREVEITGNWGFAAVPANVRQAAAITAADWFRRDVAAMSNTFNSETGEVETVHAIPRVAFDLLATYRRMAYV